MFHHAKENYFRFSSETIGNKKTPIILINYKNSILKPNLALDKDITTYYIEKFPDMAKKLHNEYGIATDKETKTIQIEEIEEINIKECMKN